MSSSTRKIPFAFVENQALMPVDGLSGLNHRQRDRELSETERGLERGNAATGQTPGQIK